MSYMPGGLCWTLITGLGNIKAISGEKYREQRGPRKQSPGMEASLGRCSWRSVTGVWFQKGKVRKLEKKGKIYP